MPSLIEYIYCRYTYPINIWKITRAIDLLCKLTTEKTVVNIDLEYRRMSWIMTRNAQFWKKQNVCIFFWNTYLCWCLFEFISLFLSLYRYICIYCVYISKTGPKLLNCKITMFTEQKIKVWEISTNKINLIKLEWMKWLMNRLAYIYIYIIVSPIHLGIWGTNTSVKDVNCWTT